VELLVLPPLDHWPEVGVEAQLAVPFTGLVGQDDRGALADAHAGGLAVEQLGGAMRLQSSA